MNRSVEPSNWGDRKFPVFWDRLEEYLADEIARRNATITHAYLGFGAIRLGITLLGFYAISRVAVAYLQDVVKSEASYSSFIRMDELHMVSLLLVGIAFLTILWLNFLVGRLSNAFCRSIKEELILKSEAIYSHFSKYSDIPSQIIELLKEMGLEAEHLNSWGGAA